MAAVFSREGITQFDKDKLTILVSVGSSISIKSNTSFLGIGSCGQLLALLAVINFLRSFSETQLKLVNGHISNGSSEVNELVTIG